MTAIHTANINNIDFQKIEEIIRRAGDMLLAAQVTDESIHQKEGLANFVTSFDVEIQKFLIRELKAVLPDAAFFGEEDTEGSSHDQLNGYCFFIDPIDGTTNFMFGYHHSCVSVGLAYRKEMIAGFVCNPYVKEMYTAIKDKGSFLNGRRLCMKNRTVAEGIISFGCARYNEGDTDKLFAAVKELYLRSLCVRNGGSAALDLCRVASGSNAAYLELKLQPYDYAAASIIIEEAGGQITQADGQPITLDAPCSIVGGTYNAAREVMEVLAQS